MTLNIWNYAQPWEERRKLISDLIAQADPDVVCLQETRHDFRFEHGKGQGEQIGERTGLHATSRVAQVYWPLPRVDEGLAILTRVPPERVMCRELTQLYDERDDENRRICLGVTVQSGTGPINVFDTHYSLSPRARLLNARETARFIGEYVEEPSFLFGDLNCEPDTAPIQFLLGNLKCEAEQADFVDCWTALHPDDRGYTYGSFDPVRRIDYALCRNAAPALLGARIVGDEALDGLFPSDHMGILIDVNV